MKRRDFLAASAASVFAAASTGLLACDPSSPAGRPSESSEPFRPADNGHLGIAHGSVWGRRGVTVQRPTTTRRSPAPRS